MMNAKELLDRLPTRDEISSLMGLAPQRDSETVASAVGVFAIGILVGAGLALLFAPKPGQELRDQIGERVNELRDRVGGEKDRMAGTA
ncbi:MAG: hypothetical protein QOD06_2428 [Candidatus Binatota bacterium]|jgi:gas vesicle protein|nr:hypothetical protein [Candidatus Binatota bacterium]